MIIVWCAVAFIVGAVSSVDRPWIPAAFGALAAVASGFAAIPTSFAAAAIFMWLAISVASIEVDLALGRGLDPAAYVIHRATRGKAERFNRAEARAKLQGSRFALVPTVHTLKAANVMAKQRKMTTHDLLYQCADAAGWDTPDGRLMLAMAGDDDPNVCGEWLDGLPCGGPALAEHDHEPMRPCCRRSASRCSC